MSLSLSGTLAVLEAVTLSGILAPWSCRLLQAAAMEIIWHPDWLLVEKDLAYESTLVGRANPRDKELHG